jgi:hypothetical protein
MTSAAERTGLDTGYGHKHSNSSNNNAEEANTSSLTRDERDMRRMGKVQETNVRQHNSGNTRNVANLKQRNFGLLPLLGVSLSSLGADNGVEMLITILEVHNNYAELLGVFVSVSSLTR